MKTIAVIIAQNGDLDALKRGDQLLVNKLGHPKILIEYGGVGAHDGAVIKVSQLVPGVGEILVNPEMHFEVNAAGVWYPYYRKDDTLPVIAEDFVLKVNLSNPKFVGFNLELQRGLIQVAQDWDRQLEKLEYHLAPVEIKFFPLAAEREDVGTANSFG